MTTIVISIGGSILLTGRDDVQYIKDLSELIQKICQEHRLLIVVGGGKLAREYIKHGRELGITEEKVLDRVGIGATRLNAMLLLPTVPVIIRASSTRVSSSVPVTS